MDMRWHPQVLNVRIEKLKISFFFFLLLIDLIFFFFNSMTKRAVLNLWNTVILLEYGLIFTILDKCFLGHSMPICCTDSSFIVFCFGFYFSKVFMYYIFEHLFYFIVVVFFKNCSYDYVESLMLSSISLILL